MRIVQKLTVALGVCLVMPLLAVFPAGAVGSITVTPSTGLVHGQVVTVVISGFTPGALSGMCQSYDADGVPDVNDCGDGPITTFTPSGAGSFSTEYTVRRFISVASGLVDCAAPAGGCTIGAAEVSDVAGTAVTAPLSFAPAPPLDPAITVTPDEGLDWGESVTIDGTGFLPNTDAVASQCLAGTAPPDCNYPFGVGVTDATGAFSTSTVVIGYVGTTNCSAAPGTCELRVAQGQTAVATAPLSFDPIPPRDPSITVTPSTGLGHGQGVTVTGTGFYPSLSVLAAVCLAGASSPPGCTATDVFANTDAFGELFGEVAVTGAIGATSCSTAPGTCEMRVTQSDLVATTPLEFDPGASDRRPDGLIVRLANGTLIGDDVYNIDAAGQQRIRPARPGTRLFFPVRIQNDSVEVDDITVTAPAGPPGFTVRYYFGLYDLTPFITTGGVTFHSINPTERRTISVDITVDSSVAPGTAMDLLVTMTSADDPTKVDAVKVGVSVSP